MEICIQIWQMAYYIKAFMYIGIYITIHKWRFSIDFYREQNGYLVFNLASPGLDIGNNSHQKVVTVNELFYGGVGSKKVIYVWHISFLKWSKVFN